MGLLFKAGTAFAVAAYFLGTGPFAGPADPHWEVVRADLAAARPQERLAAQMAILFRPGTPHPVPDR
ncbi:MAG TPA: hypothetical protein VJ798_11335 [Rhizomicrobium sp.]|nr:hypothetical protein [Rhizomicrobium sp.]